MPAMPDQQLIQSLHFAMGAFANRDSRGIQEAAVRLGLRPTAEQVEVINAVIVRLNHSNDMVRISASSVLGVAGLPIEVLLELLAPLLQDSKPSVRAAALSDLKFSINFYPSSESRVPERVFPMLSDQDEEVRVAALKVFMALLKQYEVELSPMNLSTLEADESSKVRLEVVAYHLQQDPKSEQGINLLLAEYDREESSRAAELLKSTGEAIVPILIDRLASQPEVLRVKSIRALGLLGVVAASAEDQLRAMLSKDTLPVQREIKQALKKIRPWWTRLPLIGKSLRRSTVRKTDANPSSDCVFDRLSSWKDRNSTETEKDYDIFLSYKSEDAILARQIAETLLGRNVKVWLAEYVINIEDRASFEQAIEDGICRSRWGLILANLRYSLSPHCRFELERLWQHVGAEHLLKITTTPDPFLDPRAQNLELIEPENCFDSCEFTPIVKFVMRRTGLCERFAADRSEETPTEILKNERFQYELNVAQIGGGAITQHREHGPTAEGETNINNRRLRWNLITQVRTDLPSRSTVNRENVIDDRLCFDRSMKFAKSYFQATGTRPRGTHLHFANQESHLALTYRNQGAWVRRYSLVKTMPIVDQNIEFALVFYFFGPFPEFCQFGSVMDNAAASFRWGHDDRNAQPGVVFLATTTENPVGSDSLKAPVATTQVCALHAEVYEKILWPLRLSYGRSLNSATANSRGSLSLLTPDEIQKLDGTRLAARMNVDFSRSELLQSEYDSLTSLFEHALAEKQNILEWRPK